MTGLDTQHDVIIEMATIVTDKYLNISGRRDRDCHSLNRYHFGGNGWVESNHTGFWFNSLGQSQPLDNVPSRASHLRFSTTLATRWCLAYVWQYHLQIGVPRPPNAQLEKFFHYRNLDISTIKELAKRWKPEILDGFKKRIPNI